MPHELVRLLPLELLLLLLLAVYPGDAFLSFPTGTTIITTFGTGTTTVTQLYMCQLLGMNCKQPTDFSFSFQGFCKRGGDTDIHADGWGLAFYQNNGLRQFHDDQPASKSPLADFLTHHYPIRTLNMMAHIRYATHGQVDLANVHPFVREWAGVQWCFAHNGHVPLFIDHPGITIGDKNNNQTQVYQPVGTTDSEAAFCAILNALRQKYQTTLPKLPELYQTLRELATEIVNYAPSGTIFNFLCACGPHVLWVYSWPGKRPGSDVWNGLHYTIREPPFRSCHLSDVDYTVDFQMVTTELDRVAIVATTPLTDDEEWVQLQPGELIVFDEGLPRVSPQELIQLEMMGHGLNIIHNYNDNDRNNNTDSGSLSTSKRLTEDLRRYEFQPKFHVGGGI